MSFVLDSSIALAWIYQDELTPAALQIAERVSQSGAWVPMIWRLEVANSLQNSIRRGRIDVAFRDQALADLSALNITTDSETNALAWTDTLRLADRLQLTLYDACYLELAHRRALPVASLDRDLRAAARKLKIPLL
ncbi:MAG TPA: type II toxin-antitoxin system VapC family toxin [Xanthobacteraceae bacterium]|nr:type II toxin-antitoxin system VapC family toxin [Xanthobacteraceae bacterium]